LLPAESLPGIDQCAGLRRLGGRRAVYASLLGRFASDNADVITRLRTLVATAAPREAQQVCHALRGVAGNLGADEICRAATELERSLKSPEERSSVSERLETLEQSVARVLKGLSEHRALLEAVESEPAGPLPAKNLSKNSGRNEAERRAASQGRRPEAPGGVAVVRYIEDDSGRERRMAALQPAAVGRGSWIGSKVALRPSGRRTAG
jgi:HPt (histidine-containing phosphotransfer) domain-containing protein